MDKPWIVLGNVISNPDRVIREYGHDLLDLRNEHSEREVRIVDGRKIVDSDVNNGIKNALRKSSGLLSVTYTDIEPVWLLRYRPGGHYVWHGDNEILHYPERKISVIIALNDEYEGGNTQFIWPRPGSTELVHLEPGSGVFFPAYMFHRAPPVISGERWILLTFGVGLPFQ